MKCLGFIALLGAGCVAGVAQAADQAGPQQTGVTLRLSSAIERLSNNTPDWRETTVGLKLDFKPRQTLDLSAGETRRFGLQDNLFAASYSMPLTDSLTATVDGSLSSTHRVLGRHAAGVTLQYEFAPAWLLHGGLRNSSYDSENVNQALFMLEHYFGSFSWAAGWRPTRAFDTTVNGLELRGSYYYGERNAITVIIAGGREAASVPGGVSIAEVSSAALTGRHWFDRHWAMTYGAGYARQGSLYSRSGANLGVQYAF